MYKKIFKALFLRFIPSSKKIALNDSERLANYIYENYNLNHQELILENIQISLRVKREVDKCKINQQIKELNKKESELDRFLIRTQ